MTSRRRRILETRTMRAAPAALWRAISDGGAVERWFPWVARTEVLDAAEGGLRVIHLRDGARFDEYITLNDPRTLTYQYYAPAPPLPIKDVIGTKRITRSEAGLVELSWFVTFEAIEGDPSEAEARMREIYAAALARIDEAAGG